MIVNDPAVVDAKVNISPERLGADNLPRLVKANSVGGDGPPNSQEAEKNQHKTVCHFSFYENIDSKRLSKI